MGIKEAIIFSTEIIGTVAFAFSGAITAIKYRMDIFGVMLLGMMTALGGGLIRDLILGVTPPIMFSKPIYAIVSAAVSLLIFIVLYFKLAEFEDERAFLIKMISFFDTIGLGAFTVVGVHAAILSGESSVFLMVFVGVATGIGGGIIRDIFSNQTPLVFKKEIYAVASIAGAVTYAFLSSVIENYAAMLIGAAVVIIIRLICSHFKLNLPSVPID